MEIDQKACGTNFERTYNFGNKSLNFDIFIIWKFVNSIELIFFNEVSVSHYLINNQSCYSNQA